MLYNILGPVSKETRRAHKGLKDKFAFFKAVFIQQLHAHIHTATLLVAAIVTSFHPAHQQIPS